MNGATSLDAMLDLSLVRDLNGFLARHDAVEDPISRYESWSLLLFAGGLLALVLVAAALRRRGGMRIALSAGVSAALALAVGAGISAIVARPRPFATDPGGVVLFARHAADSGFPSDHATAAFAIAIAVLLRQRAWGRAVVAAAALLAIGRVAIGVHYPSDVLAGALLGSVVAVIVSWGPVRGAVDRIADRIVALAEAVLGRIPLSPTPA